MTLDGACNGMDARLLPTKCSQANTRLIRREYGCLATQRRILCHLNTVMQQHRRRQHFKVTALTPVNQLNVAPDAHDMGQIVRTVFIRGSIEKLRRELIERVEHR